MGLSMNVVFNLNSVDELINLGKALKEAATIQAKIQLEKDIRNLKIDRDELREEIKELRDTRNRLSPSELSQADKKDKPDTENEGPTALRDESEDIIDRIQEGTERVTTAPEAPE